MLSFGDDIREEEGWKEMGREVPIQEYLIYDQQRLVGLR